jgi:hypothetical protein
MMMEIAPRDIEVLARSREFGLEPINNLPERGAILLALIERGFQLGDQPIGDRFTTGNPIHDLAERASTVRGVSDWTSTGRLGDRPRLAGGEPGRMAASVVHGGHP